MEQTSPLAKLEHGRTNSRAKVFEALNRAKSNYDRATTPHFHLPGIWQDLLITRPWCLAHDAATQPRLTRSPVRPSLRRRCSSMVAILKVSWTAPQSK